MELHPLKRMGFDYVFDFSFLMIHCVSKETGQWGKKEEKSRGRDIRASRGKSQYSHRQLKSDKRENDMATEKSLPPPFAPIEIYKNMYK